MKLDYNLKTTEERVAYVNRLLAETPKEDLKSKYLSCISDYILFVADKNQTKKEKKEENSILTRNREKTIDKRQVSFEKIVSNLENGEDGLYSMINNDKNQLLDKKNKISDKDLENIPEIKEQMEIIENLKKQFDTATGTRKFAIKKNIIEVWQQIYILKAAATGDRARGRVPQNIKTMAHADLNENIWLNDQKLPVSDGLINLFNPNHVSFLLCYYSQLKQECEDDLMSDMHWLLVDLEDVIEKALKNEPVLYDLLVWKIDGLTNEEIKNKMEDIHGVTHNEQYYSTLWRKRIPKLIVEQAQKNYLIWYYTNVEYGNWKKCNRCGEIKLAHPLFFSKNTSVDGFYSLCKDCKNASIK